MTSQPATASLVGTVVIPAHNEGTTITRTLDAIGAELEAHPELDLQVVVAANGCTDDTVAVARRYPFVTALDLPEPSKARALVRADEAARPGPRIYLDADVQLTPGTLTALVRRLTTEEAIVAAPMAQFVTESASPLVARYFDVYAKMPYVRSTLGSAGVYGLSPAGRARFGEFPDVMADDAFVQWSFADHERILVPGASLVQVPRTLKDLIRVRTRVARGNSQLEATARDLGVTYSAPTGGTLAAMRELARSPHNLPGLAVYSGVVALARWRARRAPAVAWERDASTR